MITARMTSWFGDVPDDVRIGRDAFLVAGEAIEDWQAQLTGPRIRYGWDTRGPEFD